MKANEEQDRGMKTHDGSGNDMDITRMTLTRLDDEPDAPEAPEDDNKTLNSPISELESRLFDQRKVLIFGGINDKIARDVTGRLLALAGSSDKPIDVYVNSPGGHVESGDTIHDMIRFVDSIAPINMIGTGWVASAALMAAPKPRIVTFCLPRWDSRRW